jgi:predicted DNA-binding ribbon-helix-helix protein
MKPIEPRKAGRPARGLHAMSIGLFSHQYASLERVADRRSMTFAETLRTVLDEMNEETVESDPKTIPSTVVVSRIHITNKQRTRLLALSKKTGLSMADIIRKTVAVWLTKSDAA